MTRPSEAELIEALNDAKAQIRHLNPTHLSASSAAVIERIDALLLRALTTPSQPASAPEYRSSEESRAAIQRARDMLAAGINIQATGEATNAIVTGIIESLLAAIDDLDADVKAAIAVGRYAARQASQPSTHEGKAEPVAWLHTLNMELGQKQRQLTFSVENPFGIPSADYDASYVVTTEPLYRGAPPAQPAPAVEREAVTLGECPVGLFLAGDELCLKTEYGNNAGRVDAYIVSSGEFFWGGATTPEDQRAVLVTPVRADAILALLAQKSTIPDASIVTKPSKVQSGKDAELVEALRDAVPSSFEYDRESEGFYDTDLSRLLRWAADRLEALSAGRSE